MARRRSGKIMQGIKRDVIEHRQREVKMNIVTPEAVFSQIYVVYTRL